MSMFGFKNEVAPGRTMQAPMHTNNTSPNIPAMPAAPVAQPSGVTVGQETGAELEKTFYSALTKNTYIEGNIATKDDLAFSGGLKGNINSTKVVHLDGSIIEGQLSVGEIEVENGKVKGNVSSKGALTMDSLSLIIGDVRAHDIVCDGKVKGDLYIEGSATLSANAVVFGNIKAAEINVDPGAMVRGSIEVVRQSMVASKLFEFEEEFMDMSEFASTIE